MKIAIQGHLTRGHEVIQILKSLGGKSRNDLTGRRFSQYYFINCSGDIDLNLKINLLNHKLYTLEEFEKEFPFKVGDNVIHKEFNDLFEVIAFNPELTYPYKIKGVCEFNTKSYILTKWQPKMKEERFVTLTLDKAKEWYSKGGELKEIALQAFSEKELNPLPRSWEEFCKNYQIKPGETFIDGYSKFISNNEGTRNPIIDKNVCPSKESAETHLAMIQLEQLRDCWRQGWVPDYTKTYKKYRIKKLGTEYIVDWSTGLSDFLVFQTEELAKEFLKCFRDLIEKAGDLI